MNGESVTDLSCVTRVSKPNPPLSRLR